MSRRIHGVVAPRTIESTLIVADADGVSVTWHLGEHVSANPVEYFSYIAEVTGNRGSFVRHFGLKFVGTEDPEVFPYVFDFMTSKNEYRDPDRVTITSDSIAVHYDDASVGDEPIDAAAAHANVNGVDLQTRLPVTVVDGLSGQG